jgi:hypothetical protein
MANPDPKVSSRVRVYKAVFPVPLELTSGLEFATGPDVSYNRLFLQVWITYAGDEDLNDPPLPHRALDDKAMNNVFPQ